MGEVGDFFLRNAEIFLVSIDFYQSVRQSETEHF